MKIIELDNILKELGDFGKYQKRYYALICIPLVFTGLFAISFVFSARIPEYRCYIPECDDNVSVTQLTPEWLQNAVPFKGKNPSRCTRFRYKHINESVEFNTPDMTCSRDKFDRDIIDSCDEIIYMSPKITIANDFNITCNNNHWKLTIAGTIHNVGQFICFALSGFISDRYGRKKTLISCLMLAAVTGLLRSFSPSYWWYIFFEFLEPTFGSAAYSSAFILGMELVGPSKRVINGAIISSCFSIGEALVGVTAWTVLSWRTMLRIIYTPGLLLFVYIWLAPESVRWLLSKGRVDEARKILTKAAKTNGVMFSEKAMESLSMTDYELNSNEEDIPKPKTSTIVQVFKCRPLLVRYLICIVCWITCTFVYYGLSLNSVAIAGNIYLNFIFVSLIEIPGYIVSIITLDRFGRRICLCGSLLSAGLSCIMFSFIPEGSTNIKLALFLFGKCSITISFTAIYVFTTEMFPTSVRHSLLGSCSMFGRIGSIVAPQTPLLSTIWKPLPTVAFGSMATIAGLMALLFPETKNTSLPDTVEEAKNIGELKE